MWSAFRNWSNLLQLYNRYYIVRLFFCSPRTLSKSTELCNTKLRYRFTPPWNFIQQEVCMKFTGLQILQQKLLFLQVFSNSDFAASTFHSSRIKWSYSFFFYIPMETLYNWRSLLNLQWSGATLWLPLIFCLPPFCCTDPSKHRLIPTPECAVVSALKC